MLIELGFEDRDDAFAMRGADGERPATSSLEAIFSVSFGQIQQPQARAVALLGVGPVSSCHCTTARVPAPMFWPQLKSRPGVHFMCLRCALGMCSGSIVCLTFW